MRWRPAPAGAPADRAVGLVTSPVPALAALAAGLIWGPAAFFGGLAVWLVAGAAVALVLVRGERRRLRSLPPPPHGAGRR